MTTDTLARPAHHAEPARAARPLLSTATAGSRMLVSRAIGALFLLGFLTYGIGFAMVTSITGAPGFLAAIPLHQFTLALGVSLVGSSRVDLQACKLEYSIVSPK